MLLHIIYAGADIILSKESFDSWREIQDCYEGYTASLGRWDAETVIDYLAVDYTDLHPSARAQVNALLASTSLTARLRFG